MREGINQEINDKFCVKILRMMEFEWWDVDCLEGFRKLIEDMGIASGCNNK